MQLCLNIKPFDQAIARLPGFMLEYLSKVPEDVRARATELRMRAGAAVAITLPEGPNFISASGRMAAAAQENCMRLSGEQLAMIVRSLCDYSLHSYTEDIARGFLTLPGGHRAGLCGTAVTERGTVTAVREISSVNLRIAREMPGAAAELCARLYHDGSLPGVLISGAPGSGKTTMLRDLARRLSGGLCGLSRRVALMDERGELAGVREGVPCCDVGPNTDVLTGYPKGEGVLLAVRSLSPEVILCDELGSEAEAAALAAGFHTGVRFIATIHAETAEQALRRPVVQDLLACGAFDWLVALGSAKTPCKITEIRAIDKGDTYAACRVF